MMSQPLVHLGFNFVQFPRAGLASEGLAGWPGACLTHRAVEKGVWDSLLEYPWPKVVLRLQGSPCHVQVMLLAIAFTPGWKEARVLSSGGSGLGAPSGRGSELPTLCSRSGSVWRQCALSPSSSRTPSWLWVTSPYLGSHEQPLAGSQMCPSVSSLDPCCLWGIL